MSSVHSFSKSLADSHEKSLLPLWGQVYRQAFPAMVAMISHEVDGWHQRLGVDRSVILANSKQILIDEKLRGPNPQSGRVYTDIALEYLSSVEHRTLGWVEKDLMADYIAYAIGPTGECYLLPVVQLQAAWQAHKDEWLFSHKSRDALNEGYRTRFCPVPPDDLYRAMGGLLRVEFEPVESQ